MPPAGGGMGDEHDTAASLYHESAGGRFPGHPVQRTGLLRAAYGPGRGGGLPRRCPGGGCPAGRPVRLGAVRRLRCRMGRLARGPGSLLEKHHPYRLPLDPGRRSRRPARILSETAARRRARRRNPEPVYRGPHRARCASWRLRGHSGAGGGGLPGGGVLHPDHLRRHPARPAGVPPDLRLLDAAAGAGKRPGGLRHRALVGRLLDVCEKLRRPAAPAAAEHDKHRAGAHPGLPALRRRKWPAAV